MFFDFLNLFYKAPRDENGKVKTLPRNVQISHPKAGKIKSSYFNNLSFITIGDPQ
jgi:hypothetical protein